MKRSKQARAREFSQKTRREIIQRDGGQCIFCQQQYQTNKATPFEMEIKSIMHYIPRSQNGLGIPENGAVGCAYHHHMMDNGSNGQRGNMRRIFKEYLMQQYPQWDERKLVYSKWDF